MKQYLWEAKVRITGQVKPEFVTVGTTEKNIAKASESALEKAAEQFGENKTDVIEIKYSFTMEQG